MSVTSLHINFALTLGVAVVLCVLGLTLNNLTLMLACMLISPILEIPLDFASRRKRAWSRLAMLLILPVIGYIVGKVVPKHKTGKDVSWLDAAGKAYAENAPGSYILGGVVAIACGLLLKRSTTNPVIAVAINLATALLPQCIALGYYTSDNYSDSDMLACILVFSINVSGLVVGSTLGDFLGIQPVETGLQEK